MEQFSGEVSQRQHHRMTREPDCFISTSATDAHAVQYLNSLFISAARESISDVHLEDVEDGCIIRFRRNGELEILDKINTQMSREFDSKIRMRCKMAVVERMTPLDGKFRYEVDGRNVDVRVSILPLAQGQSIVCRLLDQRGGLMTLDDLEMDHDVRSSIQHIINQPQGLFLVTGPTGSGKTTTLYGILQQLNQTNSKLITVEDPVEYRLPGVCQVQTNHKLTFANALKSILRQDPDIVLVGEIRDSETARIAAQASLTGHIVLSTLHTNNALITLNRMLDLDVDPNVLSASMTGFMAQRLVKRLCQHCAIPEPMNESTALQMISQGVSEERTKQVQHIYSPNLHGCDACNGRGWQGRMPVIELIVSTPEVRYAIERSDLKALERAALLQPQYKTLGHHAMSLVLEGKTSITEAVSVVGSAISVSE